MRILVFKLNGEQYGIAADAVVEIIRAVALKPLPSLPNGLTGVFDLRGEIVPVVDVRKRFNIAGKPLDPSDHFVIVRLHDSLVGLHVDQAVELEEIDDISLSQLSDIVAGESRVKGAARVNSGMVVIYDIDAFLTKSEATEVKELIASETARVG